MDITVVLLFILGLILIVKGGDWFVDSSVELAKMFKIPPIIIGATVVSIATTLPEATVSSIAAFKGVSTMAVGNAVGSMICNIGLLGGIVIIFSGINVKKKSILPKSIILASYTLLLIIFGLDKQIVFVEGVLLLSLFIGYLVYNASNVKKGKAKEEFIDDESNDDYPLSKVMVYFVIGVIGILIGSRLLINNGVLIARAIGVSEAIIALSFIAFGTSLPELVTVITSLKKGNTDIGIGNIIGANIFNVSLVIGASSVISDLEIIDNNLNLDFPIVVVLTMILLIPLVLKGKSTKLQGFALLSTYVFYMFLLWT
jgi:cation:H+ antiporter